ncbi:MULTISPECIES: phytoene desaturase family protein [Streptomyces]|uniref:Phytoene desaturase n=1 Tax=Streptomyces reniochalinae TaxID=2250578 RepID=A0A367EAU3_9ACTN|nr:MULTISPECIES: phytoene desaturase family protein [Streptomyces]RCG14909.1 phytoene desaturase [Streptomyces reniochalinae]
MARIVVVGAGMGGLAAAARLAVGGHRVTVCERTQVSGGKLGVHRREGFVFDTGPSLLTMPDVYRQLFTDTGAPLEYYCDLSRVDPACWYRFADGTQLSMPGNSREVPAALDQALGDGAGQQWSSLHETTARLWHIVNDTVMQRPLQGPRDLLRHATRLRDLAAIAPWRTLRGMGSRHLHDWRLRTWLDRYATYTGSDPRRTPAVMAVAAHIEQHYGAWYVKGGLHRLAQALHERCLERGVRFHHGCEVVEVTTAGTRVDGVRLRDGSALAADVVISNADAAHLYGRLTADPRSQGAHTALRRAVPSFSGFALLMALRGRERGTPHHRVFFPRDYDAEFDALFGSHARPVTDPAIYISAPDDPALRPDNAHEAWFVLVNAPRHSPSEAAGTVDWEATGLRHSYAEHVLDVLADRGLDVRDRLLWYETRTPADLERHHSAPGGAIYGTSSNGLRAAFLRPANRSPVPGLFLVGGSSHPGGGLPLVALSASITASLIGAC